MSHDEETDWEDLPKQKKGSVLRDRGNRDLKFLKSQRKKESNRAERKQVRRKLKGERK